MVGRPEVRTAVPFLAENLASGEARVEKDRPRVLTNRWAGIREPRGTHCSPSYQRRTPHGGRGDGTQRGGGSGAMTCTGYASHITGEGGATQTAGGPAGTATHPVGTVGLIERCGTPHGPVRPDSGAHPAREPEPIVTCTVTPPPGAGRATSAATAAITIQRPGFTAILPSRPSWAPREETQRRFVYSVRPR